MSDKIIYILCNLLLISIMFITIPRYSIKFCLKFIKINYSPSLFIEASYCIFIVTSMILYCIIEYNKLHFGIETLIFAASFPSLAMAVQGFKLEFFSFRFM